MPHRPRICLPGGLEQREKTVFYEGRARPWLLGVALNVLRSQSRAERRYRDALARIPAAASPEPESDAAIARLDAERQRPQPPWS